MASLVSTSCRIKNGVDILMASIVVSNMLIGHTYSFGSTRQLPINTSSIVSSTFIIPLLFLLAIVYTIVFCYAV